MLSVMFNPQFGAESEKQNDGAALQSPPVYLTFWGSYWGGNNSAAANTIKAAAASVLSTPYLSGLTQYHSDGLASLASTSAWDSSNPSNGGFNGNNIDDVVQNQIDNGPLPESDTPANTPIYVVVTPPGIFSSVANAGGFNILGHDTDVGFLSVDYDDIPEVWVSTSSYANGTLNTDLFTRYFSHEVAEIMSDLGGGGYKIYPGATWTGGGSDQIGDNEGNSYTWREPNGALVQPYWSARDNRWLAPDGNSQTLYLNPIWAGNSYTTQNTLDVHGDQLGANYNDTITIDQTPAGGVQITLNGEVTAFDPGTITAINVNTYGGTNTVNVRNVPSGVTLDIQGGGSDTVNVGSAGSVQGIQGAVYIENQPSTTAIHIDDSADRFARTTTLGTYTPSGDSAWGYIAGLSPYANINYEYADTTSVTIDTGTASGNVINVWESGVPINLIDHGTATYNIGDGLVGRGTS